jgi:hypothetical protein
MKHMPIGEKHGKLTCVSLPIPGAKKHHLFECECGAKKSVNRYKVVASDTSTCGNPRCNGRKKHDRYGTRLYRLWAWMIQRCECKQRHNYHLYGGRGIKVCDEWRDNPEAFCQWCEQNGYEKGLQIDRIDSDGNYSPENCRFVTRRENQQNMRSNRYVTIDGVSRCLSEWAKRYGLSVGCLQGRLNSNWHPIIALTKPSQRKRLRGKIQDSDNT